MYLCIFLSVKANLAIYLTKCLQDTKKRHKFAVQNLKAIHNKDYSVV